MSQEVHVGPKYSLMVSLFLKIVYFSSCQTVIIHVHVQIFGQLRKILYLDDEPQFAACIEDFQAQGFPLIMTHIRSLIWQYAQTNGIPGFSQDDDKAERSYAKHFLK